VWRPYTKKNPGSQVIVRSMHALYHVCCVAGYEVSGLTFLLLTARSIDPNR
jgi:hypothetical protein